MTDLFKSYIEPILWLTLGLAFAGGISLYSGEDIDIPTALLSGLLGIATWLVIVAALLGCVLLLGSRSR